jgi:murein DD-endopeptidase MepM/ murein hydrolase activator NlpD
VTAKVTSPYGPRRVICNTVGCSNTFHDGVDFGSACGTPIKAISPGRVTFAGNAGSFGERVIIDHGSGVESLYGHAQTGSLNVSVGQLVKAGTVIAKVGATGVVTGCHLDLKIRISVFVDPGPFLAARGVTL